MSNDVTEILPPPFTTQPHESTANRVGDVTCMTENGDPSQDFGDILRGIEELSGKARTLHLHALSYLLDMARLEAIRLTDPQRRRQR